MPIAPRQCRYVRGVHDASADRLPRLTLKDLLAAGILQAGEVWQMPRGRRRQARVEATVTQDGQLLLNGELFKSPSAAATAVRHGIQTNGWLTWSRWNGQEWERVDIARHRRRTVTDR